MQKSLFILILLITNLCYSSSKALTSEPGITVYVAGDVADCSTKKLAGQSQATAEIINAGILQNPDAIVLTLGDHTYPVGTPAEFETCYEPTWGKFKNRTYPAAGNHEYQTPSAYAYFRYFGRAAGSQKQPYYSFNKGNWHIISLDSNLKKEQRQTQFAWLKQDLNKNRSSCILAFWHHPLYSSGLHGNYSTMKAAWNLLMTAKADLILSSHDHLYERFKLQNSRGEQDEQSGIREFIVGTGGAGLTPSLWQKQHSEVLNTNTHGVLKLVLKKQSYEWQFLPVKGSSFTDEGSGVCHHK